MRIAKIPAEIVQTKVLESLRSRMDPATRRVYPGWKQMMREIGVCRQRIADAVKSLKEQGAFTAGTEERRRGITRSTSAIMNSPLPLMRLLSVARLSSGERRFDNAKV